MYAGWKRQGKAPVSREMTFVYQLYGVTGICRLLHPCCWPPPSCPAAPPRQEAGWELVHSKQSLLPERKFVCLVEIHRSHFDKPHFL